MFKSASYVLSWTAAAIPYITIFADSLYPISEQLEELNQLDWVTRFFPLDGGTFCCFLARNSGINRPMENL